jgi:hypothetical protein
MQISFDRLEKQADKLDRIDKEGQLEGVEVLLGRLEVSQLELVHQILGGDFEKEWD